MRVNFYDMLLTEDKTISLVKEKAVNYNVSEIRTPEVCYNLACNILQMNTKVEEHCYMIDLNTKGKISGIFFISKGSVSSTIISARDIFKRALLCGASGIILMHNHPSGDPEPSKEDYCITQRIKNAGDLLEVMLLDHIIVGDGKYYSFKEKGGL